MDKYVIDGGAKLFGKVKIGGTLLIIPVHQLDHMK